MKLGSDYNIKEKSWIAKIASMKLRARSVAIVIGKTIHLNGTTRQNFLENDRWLKHELCHIAQFRQHGLIPFIFKYLWESLKDGYYQNRFEKEARAAEEM